MFLYMSIVSISILCYFGDVESNDILVKEHNLQNNDLETVYIEQIVNQRRNIDDSYRICSRNLTDESRRLVMTVCKSTLSELRQTISKYEDDLYVYYQFYDIETEPLCGTSPVELSKPYHSFRKEDYIEQLMVPCYGHPPIIEGKVPVSKLRNFYKILIYPTNHSYQSWLVFEYNSPTRTYALIKWYHISNVIENLVPVDLLLFPPPMATSDLSEIYTTLSPFISTWNHLSKPYTHVLSKLNSSDLRFLCIKITKKAAKETTNYKNIPKPSQSVLPLILRSPKNGEHTVLWTPAYNCDRYIVNPGWFLFTAPGDDAILLGTNADGSTSSNTTETFYIITKYIKNINEEFLYYIF